MQDRKELIKAIVEAISPLIDAKNDILKTVLLAEIKASEQRLTKKIEAVEKKLDDKLTDHETRIKQLETASLPHRH